MAASGSSNCDDASLKMRDTSHSTFLAFASFICSKLLPLHHRPRPEKGLGEIFELFEKNSWDPHIIIFATFNKSLLIFYLKNYFFALVTQATIFTLKFEGIDDFV